MVGIELTLKVMISAIGRRSGHACDRRPNAPVSFFQTQLFERGYHRNIYLYASACLIIILEANVTEC